MNDADGFVYQATVSPDLWTCRFCGAVVLAGGRRLHRGWHEAQGDSAGVDNKESSE